MAEPEAAPAVPTQETETPPEAAPAADGEGSSSSQVREATSVEDARALYFSGPTGRNAVLQQAKREWDAYKAAPEDDKPATPAREFIRVEFGSKESVSKDGTKKTEAKGTRVNLSDDEVKDMIREFLSLGVTTVGGIVRQVRGTNRGTNQQRLARLYLEVKKEDNPESVEEAKAVAEAEQVAEGDKEVEPAEPTTPGEETEGEPEAPAEEETPAEEPTADHKSHRDRQQVA